MTIDSRLDSDCHRLGAMDRASVLLHRQASVGWLILVPDTDALDWHELDDAEYQRVNDQIRELCGWAAEWFSADKMNVATLGNEVAQMHIHIIARHRSDACWPAPVWGRLPANGPAYETATIEAIRAALGQYLNLVPYSD